MIYDVWFQHYPYTSLLKQNLYASILLEYYANFINLLCSKFRKIFHSRHEHPFNFGVHSFDCAVNIFKVIPRNLFRWYILIRLYIFPKPMIDFILLQNKVQHSLILIKQQTLHVYASSVLKIILLHSILFLNAVSKCC